MRTCVVCLFAASLALASPAVAQERRPLPDYDGRVEPGDDAVDALLWIPRVVTAPLYAISEFVLRRPIGWLLTEIERANVLQTIAGVLTFGAERNIGVFPTAFFDFGLVPSVGVYAFWNRFLFSENRISVHGATWGEDWLSLAVADRVTLADGIEVFVSNRLLRRPDAIFGGIGHSASANGRARFAVSLVETRVGIDAVGIGPFSMHAALQHRSIGFGESNWNGSPSMSEWFGQRSQPLPHGYPDGYQSLGGRITAALDSRARGAAPEGGARIGVLVGETGTIDGPQRNAWLVVGGELELAADIESHHVISVRGEVAALTGHDDVAIPFYELLDPGGTGPMRGFLAGTLRGESVAAMTLEYAWPVWVFLNGRLHVTCGNAFERHFADFAVERLRLSFGLGLEPRIAGEHPFDLQIALGTSTFENGTSVESVRFVVGARNGL
ncbi:Hypothetical protein I5071_51200 [Sandaracinus amylolyticus]|nr:Hypothetical protein I5071_51200 [Sandaracinus amylolyticus]